MLDGSRESERIETIDEMLDLFVVIQEMGRRLADESHGDDYAKVRELNELLHRARTKLNLIKDEAGKSS